MYETGKKLSKPKTQNKISNIRIHFILQLTLNVPIPDKVKKLS